MVVCAVRCEPVSIPNSLLTANITGNCSNLATLSDSSCAKTHALQRLQRRFRFDRGTEGHASVWARPKRMRSCESLGDRRDGARHPRPGVRAVLRPRGIGNAGERLVPPKSLKLPTG